MTTVVDRIHIAIHGNLEQPLFIEIESPQVILQIEYRRTVLMLLKLLPDTVEKLPVLLGGYTGALLPGCRAIAPEGKDVDALFHNEIDNVGNLIDICARHGGHHRNADTVAPQYIDGLQRRVKRTRLTDQVVGVSHAVDRQLILPTTRLPETPAYPVGDMKRIAEYRKRDIAPMQQVENVPHTTVEQRVATCNIEIWQPVHTSAHILTLVNNLASTLKRHLYKMGMTLGENITVVTPLVAAVGYMPLKSEIFHRSQSAR